MNSDDFDKKVLLEPHNMIMMYARGAFPMGDLKGEIDWYLPQVRAIIPLEDYNIPRSLKKFLKETEFKFKFDHNSEEIIKECANREKTWITDELISAYKKLINIGYLHSVSVYESNELVGGLYGITFKGVFFGESMFSKVEQSSKAALVKLIERLIAKRYDFIDVQFLTEHLKMFGAVEISFEEFKLKLRNAYKKNLSF